MRILITLLNKTSDEIISPENLVKSLRRRSCRQLLGTEMKLWFHGGTFYVAHCSPCVCMITYISVSSPWLLFHQLHPPCFTLPAQNSYTHYHTF